MSSSGVEVGEVAAPEVYNDPLENVTDGAASGPGSSGKVRHRKSGEKKRQKAEDGSRRERDERERRSPQGSGVEAQGGQDQNNVQVPNPENNAPNDQEGENEIVEEINRDEEFVKEAISSVLFAQLEQIEAEGLDLLAKDVGVSPSKGSPPRVLPAYFRQNIYWPPYKRTLANITSLPVVEVALDKTAALHDRLKGVIILGSLYKFNVWWVSYLTDCAKEGLRIFRKVSQRLTPPIIHDVLVWMERKFWELIRWADRHISKGLEWIEDNYPIVTHTPSEVYADGKDKVEQALDWIQSFWIFNNSIFAYVRKTLGLGELRPAVEQNAAAPVVVNGGRA